MAKRAAVHPLRRLLSAAPNLTPEIRGGGDQIAEILYTGGTTKHPKGVPISHRLYLGCAEEQLSTSLPLFPNEENIILGGAPLFHILGQTCSLGTILLGGTLVVFPKVHLDALMHAMQRYRAKTFIGVPSLFRMILEHQRVDFYDLSSLRYCFCGGDVLPLEVEKRWQSKMNRPIYQGYGATETCGGISMASTARANPSRSMGRIVASKSVLVVDPNTLEEMPHGEAGELLVTSDPMVTAYWNKPEETAAAFVSLQGRLWYRTSDMVSRDEQGYLYFVDRTVDTIKHKGYRISASEIEAVLQEHPAVIESCVVGVPDEKVGQRIKAFVVLKKDIKGVTGYDLITWCRERLVSYKLPQYIEFRDMLPKSKVGKLLRREIRGEEHRRMEKDENRDSVLKDTWIRITPFMTFTDKIKNNLLGKVFLSALSILSIRKTTRRNRINAFIGLGLTLLITCLMVLEWSPLENLEDKLLDYRFKIRGPQKPPDQVVIAAIDDKSIDRLGRWPWSREVLARLIERLGRAGAELIFLDIILSEEEKNDPLLSKNHRAGRQRHPAPGL